MAASPNALRPPWNLALHIRLVVAPSRPWKKVDSPQGDEFPQTSTMFQWYELEEFEAYRHLGYLMGWAYLSSLSFNEAELTPAAACHAL